MLAYPWHAWLLLYRPARVQARLDGLRSAEFPRPTPNLWQIELGVLRMWHRMLFRSDTIGVSTTDPVRSSWRARLLQWRPLRFFFLVWEGSFVPWDSSGLLSSPDRIVRHILANHHDSERFLYDLQMLLAHPDHLAALSTSLQAILSGTEPRTEWWRDLCVYEGYHEALAVRLERFLAGEHETPALAEDSDASFFAYLRWCASQPETPGQTWAALRAGRYSFHLGVK